MQLHRVEGPQNKTSKNVAQSITGTLQSPQLNRRLPIGAELQSDCAVHFRVWANKPKRVELALVTSPSNPPVLFPMEAESDGYCSLRSMEAKIGMRYGFRLDGGEQIYPDPASRFQPDGPAGLSQIIDPNGFQWTDERWAGPKPLGQVVYEMHLGTFSPEGTWAGAMRELPELARIGITLIEVMPVADFPGKYGWGYDGVSMFAPSRLYGQPDDFRRFVDTAHSLGLGVILDVVFNHFGNIDNYLGVYSEHYHTSKYQNEWAAAINFDGPHCHGVREFFTANVRYWVQEFHLDGFRYDATQSIFDCSGEHILAVVNAAAREAAGNRRVYLVAENEPEDVRLVQSPDQCGYDMDAMWNDDFHHAAHVRLTGNNPAYYSDFLGTTAELAAAVKWGFIYQGQYSRWQEKRRGTPTRGLRTNAFVSFLQNHDQVSNSPTGQRIQQLTSSGKYRAMTALWLVAPQTPLFFQGQEFAASAPFQFFADYQGEIAEAIRKGRADFLSQFPTVDTPDGRKSLPNPLDPAVFERCKLDLSERERHSQIYQFHIDLLKLRREDPVFCRQRADLLETAVLTGDALIVRYFGDDNDDRLVIANFGADLHMVVLAHPLLAPPIGKKWRKIFDTNQRCYGGLGGAPLERSEDWFLAAECTIVLRSCGRPAKNARSIGGRTARPKPTEPRATVMKTPILHHMPWSSVPDRNPEVLLEREWLVTNGLGGYASGTVCGACTRRYHGLLIAALAAPLGRFVMFNHLAEELKLEDRKVLHLGGEEAPGRDPKRHSELLGEFRVETGLPIWQYEVGSVRLEKRVLLPYLQNTVFVIYRLLAAPGSVRLRLRPSLHFRPHEAPVSDPHRHPYALTAVQDRIEIRGEPAPPLRMQMRAQKENFVLDGCYRQIFYRVEKSRGYESEGSLWSPGYFRADLKPGEEAAFIASTETWDVISAVEPKKALESELARQEKLLYQAHPQAQEGFPAELVLAADQFIIRPVTRVADAAAAHAAGDDVRTVIAGYHWFTDWGRDTMISLEGLTLLTGRTAEAGYLLRTFARYVHDGLIPNLFPEGENQGQYHTADATMWYFHALERYLQAAEDWETLKLLMPTLHDIVEHHLRGTRFGIHVDEKDGLLSQGAQGYQLTWMDAKVGDWVVTPRRGKAVEINALWYNALRLLEGWSHRVGDDAAANRLAQLAEKTQRSFNERFWYGQGNYLYDVVDGENGDDAALRPNQVFAISLDHPILDKARWKAVMEQVTNHLLTPMGLRSLAPEHPDYKPTYDGDLRSRDAAYHQGTVWAWLIGPYIDAWLRVYPYEAEHAHKLLDAFENHMNEACIGSISEVFDAEPPYKPRGCIAQAWSVAEVLRAGIKTSAARGSKSAVKAQAL